MFNKVLSYLLNIGQLHTVLCMALWRNYWSASWSGLQNCTRFVIMCRCWRYGACRIDCRYAYCVFPF